MTVFRFIAAVRVVIIVIYVNKIAALGRGYQYDVRVRVKGQQFINDNAERTINSPVAGIVL